MICILEVIVVLNKIETKASKNLIQLGWREWVGLPDLGIDRLKVKVDTGARTSALHAFSISEIEIDGKLGVNFLFHPDQYDLDKVLSCDALVTDCREVTDSGGHTELRYVITSKLLLAGLHWPIELTLTSRDNMRFRMLLGRTAMNGRCIVNPVESYLQGGSEKKAPDI